jgi:hypothetical protein
MRRSKRIVRFTGYAIHSLLSAVKIVLLHLVSLFNPKGTKQEIRPDETVFRRVLDRLNRASNNFAQGFKEKDYYNPVTHENDEFTEVEIHRRVAKWHDILAND